MLVINEYYRQLAVYKNRKVIDIKHSEEQFKIRMPKLDFSIWLDTVKKGIDKIITDYKDERDNFVIKNTKYNFAIQIDWRPDKNNPEGINHAYTATTLGPNEQRFYTKGDTQVFVEQLKGIPKKGYMKSYYRLKHINEDMKSLYYDVFIECGKIYYTYEIIEV